MNVFVVTLEYPYDTGSSIIGVFTTRKLAIHAIEMHNENKLEPAATNRNMYPVGRGFSDPAYFIQQEKVIDA